MGGCVSTMDRLPGDPLGKEHLGPEGRWFKRECKMLLLGSCDSGKSTIVKQMKIIHQGGFSDAELAEFRPVVYETVLQSTQHVIRHMQKIGIKSQHLMMDYKIEKYNFEASFVPEIAEAIHQLVKDPKLHQLINEQSSEFYLMDSAQYFLGEVLRIGTPGYLPNISDILRARQRSVGITGTRFNMGQLLIHMFDVGGQRSERKNWISCFESVTSIIFCTALSEYDQVLLEDKSQNRMAESLVLFESVVNSRWFLHTSIILIFNKIDVFKHKLAKVPLEWYFPEYTGGSDVNKAAKYILARFMQANRAQLRVHPHITQATDTTNIRLVFATVQKTILQNALKDSGIV
ncbi:heterotrimeric G-protein alpha subunit, GPA3-like protein [Laccaria bicolor S238N-H82]|uniref:Heterotrimeric G-protein alpha subunit, GPA3-like protein n=1 Tax=Laccaria bicolor (strain S238N-H82 / ATCC MYA-4686) TaxID=486041 RepID=B0DUW4_LACBS|nr:heterotrimeric G-protein alpha subunit, GPA3-like protein [Laccaria bicolor S238N-H82]EDR01615.1 heterotrimeric G-protein alpha subunit, GPA3-like protein [Laccaria bicolor S238N-H82]|eukprot:XP_001887691.1 heterotrimeric G-protein alpha subunit, GPA3-like protein [Laccaria bicolor S238N-H82]